MAKTGGNGKGGSRKDHHTAMVLAGGGVPGWMYEIGVLTALDEFFEDGFSTRDFDIYVGTSAGSTAAALLANGAVAREMYDAIMADTPSPYNFKRRNIYAFGTGETWSLIKKAAASAWRVGWQIIRDLFRRGHNPSLLDIIYTVQEGLPSGLFTLRPLRRYLRNFLSEPPRSDDFRELSHKLFIPAVNLDTGEYVIFGSEGYDHVPISRAVAASSAVPVLFQPVNIDGADYIDGGTGRVANMNVAVDQGASLILVINPIVHLHNDKDKVCFPTCYGFCKGLKDKGMSFIADQAMRVNTAMRLRNAKARQESMFPGIDIEIIEPSPHDTTMFTQNVVGHEARKDVLQYGYRSTVEYLVAHFAHLEKQFNKRGIKVTLNRFRWRPKASGFRVLGPEEREKVASSYPVSEIG